MFCMSARCEGVSDFVVRITHKLMVFVMQWYLLSLLHEDCMVCKPSMMGLHNLVSSHLVAYVVCSVGRSNQKVK